MPPRRTACNSSISQPDTGDTVSAVSFIKTPSLCRLLFFFFLTSFWPNWQQPKPLCDHWSLPRGPHTNYPAQSHGSETFFRALGQRLDGAVQGETSTDGYLFAIVLQFFFFIMIMVEYWILKYIQLFFAAPLFSSLLKT